MRNVISQVSAIITKKRDSVKKDNDFIYNLKVVQRTHLPIINAANVVHALDFNSTDPHNVTPDLFKSLIPLEAHKISSIYSEEKAKKLRKILDACETKSLEIQKLMSLMNIDSNILSPEEHLIPLSDDLLQCCASLNADSSIINELKNLMQKLSDSYYDVKDTLESIDEKIKSLENSLKSNKEFSSSVLLYKKLYSALEDANLSNEALAKNVAIILPNLKLLAGPLKDVEEKMDFFSFLKDKENLSKLDDFKKVFLKMKEMMSQRNELIDRLRVQIQNDDVTDILFQMGQNIQELFARELQKHDELIKYIEQNLNAQDKIIESVKEANVAFAPVHKLILTAVEKRKSAAKEYVDSFELSNDLKMKIKEGISFFEKLLTNAESLLKQVNEFEKMKVKLSPSNVSTTTPRLQDIWDVYSKRPVNLSGASHEQNRRLMQYGQNTVNRGEQIQYSPYQKPVMQNSDYNSNIFYNNTMASSSVITTSQRYSVPQNLFYSSVNLVPKIQPVSVTAVSDSIPTFPVSAQSTSRAGQFLRHENFFDPRIQIQPPQQSSLNGAPNPQFQAPTNVLSNSTPNAMYNDLSTGVAKMYLTSQPNTDQTVSAPTNFTTNFSAPTLSLPNPEDVYKPGYYRNFMNAAIGHPEIKKQ